MRMGDGLISSCFFVSQLKSIYKREQSEYCLYYVISLKRNTRTKSRVPEDTDHTVQEMKGRRSHRGDAIQLHGYMTAELGKNLGPYQ